jgi:thiol-disulfide isomerase/thioredoxin
MSKAMRKAVITELNVAQLRSIQAMLKNQVMVIKFGAEWCGPCKTIAPAYQEFVLNCPINIVCADIDVDENLDLYASLKKQKMVKGIPVFLAFWGGVKRDAWYIPDDSVVGADPAAVNDFFLRCARKAQELTTEGYSYYT